MTLKAFNAEHVLGVAGRLASQDDEASARSAISRAYYGLFLLARDVALINDDSARAHVMTWQYYKDRGEKQIAEDLQHLRLARNRADYKTDINVIDKDCRLALQASRRVHAGLKRIVGREQYRARSEAEEQLP